MKKLSVAMTDMVLTRPIQLADQIANFADHAYIFKLECADIKAKSKKLAALFRQAADRARFDLRQSAQARFELYEGPTCLIIHDIQHGLEKALALVIKCRRKGLISRLFPRVPQNVFLRVSSQLQNSIENFSWLLGISAATVGNNESIGMPPVASSEPNLYLIWQQIATLSKGSLDARSDAAASLVSLARDSNRYGKLIIEEGGVVPLLKLAKNGRLEGKENAIRAIGLLGHDPGSVEHMIHAGACHVFAWILKHDTMKVQAVVAWAVSELTANHPNCQDSFAENNILRLLVRHLAFETVQENSKYAVTSKHIPEANIANASSKPGEEGKHSEDPATKAMMKAMTSRALWHLAVGNPQICKSIAVSEALLSFAVLLDKGTGEAQHNSAMALMEISAVAEQDADLRSAVFKPDLDACKAVVDQLLKIIEKADSNLLIPCIKSVGHLARMFKATETRIIGPLVSLLEGKEAEVSREAANALTKFASPKNYLRRDHSKAIINAGGAEHLIKLVDFGEEMVQIPSSILLSYIALNVPDHETLAHTEVLSLLDWVSKQNFMVQDPSLKTLLPKAIDRLKLCQSESSTGLH